jgi:hypothetical protein
MIEARKPSPDQYGLHLVIRTAALKRNERRQRAKDIRNRKNQENHAKIVMASP